MTGMTIVSISLNKTILDEIDALQKDVGYSGRSEIVRDALRLLLLEHKEQQKLKGTQDAVLLVVHDEKHSEDVSAIRHNFQALIKTQVHNHLANHKCLELFILNGDAKKIIKLTDAFQANRKIEFVKLVVA